MIKQEKDAVVFDKVLNGQTYSISNYAEYQKAMKKLKSADNANAFDVLEEPLNDREALLSETMSHFRTEVMNGKYVNALETGAPKPKPYPPIRPFYEFDVRGTIEADPLFKVFQKMPKGGNLHIHTSATLSAGNFVSMLCSDGLNRNDAGKVAVYLGEDESVYKKYSLFYVKADAVLQHDMYFLNDAISKKLLEVDTLVDMLTFSSDRIKNVPYIWDEFNNIFSRVSNVLKTKAVFKEYYKKAFKELIDDNIDYVELRFGPSTLVDYNNVPFAKQTEMVFPEGETNNSIELIRDVYYEIRNDHNNFMVKLILSDSRKKSGNSVGDIQNAIFSMKQAIIWKNKYKDINGNKTAEFIIGYDLVSEEDRGYDTDLFAKAIFENRINIPFYFHDGESLWADNDNLFSAYLLGTKRVGHGINLYRFPAVLESVKENNIALEICPISNQLLRYTQDLRIHPIAEYMKRGVQCVICSDDPQIFNYSGLSYDFWEVYYATLIDLKAVRTLIKNSYTYSGMSEEEKALKIDIWQKAWDAFVEEAIMMLT